VTRREHTGYLTKLDDPRNIISDEILQNSIKSSLPLSRWVPDQVRELSSIFKYYPDYGSARNAEKNYAGLYDE